MRPLLVLLAFLILAAPARAAGPKLGIADDRLLLAGGPQADQLVKDWADAGVEQVRILALWSRIAGPSPEAPKQWAELDAAMHRVTGAGLEPILTITGPGPLWTSRRAERGDPRYQPDPGAFADFAREVATRYGNHVRLYIIWNEPNLSTWLRPQATCSRTCTSAAPHVYRELVRAAYPAVHGADGDAKVLIGTMSSRGGSLTRENSTHRPLAFLRALGCVDSRFKRVTSGGCKGFKPATGDGFAFHPHGVLTAPDKAFPHADDVSMASLPRLESALDRLQRAGRLKATTSRFDLYLDEYGYQTNPPDRISGVSATTQNTWLQRAAYLAWRDKRVKLFTQYLWRDEPDGNAGIYSGWQSGLYYLDGRAKPSRKSFPTPFVLDAPRKRLWGQVRRRDTRTVTVQRRLRGSSTWRDVATRTTDAQGYWSWSTSLVKGASYRFTAGTAVSGTATRR